MIFKSINHQHSYHNGKIFAKEYFTFKFVKLGTLVERVKLPEIYDGKEILRIALRVFLSSMASDMLWLPIIT
jgi:hypothetical protein